MHAHEFGLDLLMLRGTKHGLRGLIALPAGSMTSCMMQNKVLVDVLWYCLLSSSVQSGFRLRIAIEVWTSTSEMAACREQEKWPFSGGTSPIEGRKQ